MGNCSKIINLLQSCLFLKITESYFLKFENNCVFLPHYIYIYMSEILVDIFNMQEQLLPVAEWAAFNNFLFSSCVLSLACIFSSVFSAPSIDKNSNFDMSKILSLTQPVKLISKMLYICNDLNETKPFVICLENDIVYLSLQ